MPAPLIALLSDFGHKDAYVGAMKAAILARCPDARLLDLCHELPAQELTSASYVLKSGALELSPGTIVVAVVDPGSATGQRPVAVELGPVTVLAPDNGLLTSLMEHWPVKRALCLDQIAYHREAKRATFHGRDLYAPVAGHLASGVELTQVGTPIDPDTLIRLPQLVARQELEASRCVARVLHVDHFGNLITSALWPQIQALEAHAGPLRVRLRAGRWQRLVPFHQTYAQVEPGMLLAYRGSSDHVEIAANLGDATQVLGLDTAAKRRALIVEVEPQ